jgi:murein L,D-transpeptidase YcbB/YkuD
MRAQSCNIVLMRVLAIALILATLLGPAEALPALPGRAVAREAELLQSVRSPLSTALLWSTAGKPTPRAGALVELLQHADGYGLRPDDYAAGLLAAEYHHLATTSAISADELQRFDDQLSVAAIRLLTHLHSGRVDPRRAGFEIRESRVDLDVVPLVRKLAATPDTAQILAAVEPAFYHYALLKQALARYRVLALDRSLTALPSIGRHSLAPGDVYPGAPSLRKLLIALGDLSPDQSPSDRALDAALIGALKMFQTRHGLPSDGTLGQQTYRALTTPLTRRVRQLELTLERWRWLPTFDSPPIIVNIPQFQLFAFRTNQDRYADIMQMPVIVGQAYPHTRTPVFVSDIRYVIFRPYWDVPRSIVLREMLPAIYEHSDYLARNNLEIISGQGDDGQVLALGPATIAGLQSGQLRLRQRPGDDNALGLIKFVFPNEHNVYMHSTPAHQLFLQSRRTFSHGCIRVSDPVALAGYVLRNAPGDWNETSITAAMHGQNNLRVVLSRPIRVMILYGTALATEAGPVLFFDDIYGHDRRLEALLGSG